MRWQRMQAGEICAGNLVSWSLASPCSFVVYLVLGVVEVSSFQTTVEVVSWWQEDIKRPVIHGKPYVTFFAGNVEIWGACQAAEVEVMGNEGEGPVLS